MKQFEGTYEEIASAVAAEDAYQGYPKDRGTFVGRGPHHPGPTITWAIPEKHPTKDLYAMPVRDAAHEGRLMASVLAGGRRPVNPSDFNERAPDWERDRESWTRPEETP